MAVTVSRPVVHDSGLGTLAQILGVYVGYQNMKIRRSGELRKLGLSPAARDNLGKGDPFKKAAPPPSSGTRLGETLATAPPEYRPGHVEQGDALKPRIEQIEYPENIDVYSPPAKVDFPVDTGINSQPVATEFSGQQDAIPPAPLRAPQSKFDPSPGFEFEAKPGVSIPAPVKGAQDKFTERLLGMSGKELDKAEKGLSRAQRQRWGNTKAKRLFPELKGMSSKDKAPMDKIVNAVGSGKNLSPGVKANVMKAQYRKLSPEGKRQVDGLSSRAMTDPTVALLNEQTGLNANQHGWANTSTETLSDNYAAATHGKSDRERLEVARNYSRMQATINYERHDKRNWYEGELNSLEKRYGAANRPRARGQYIAPKRYQVERPSDGKIIYTEAHSPEQAQSKFTRNNPGMSIDINNVQQYSPERAGGDTRSLAFMQREFERETEENPSKLSSYGVAIYDKTKGKRVSWYDKERGKFVTVDRGRYLKSMADEAKASYSGDLDDENEDAFRAQFGFNYEDFVTAKEKNKSLKFENYARKFGGSSAYASSVLAGVQKGVSSGDNKKKVTDF